MNKYIKTTLKILKTVIATALFFAILLFGAANLSVLLRFEEDERSVGQMNGYYAEKKGNLDVVCIGASSIYRYNIPTMLWKEHGITSYNYCTAAQPFEAMKYLVQEVKRTQNPKLYVIDIRNFVKRQMLDRGEYGKKDDAYYVRETSYISRMVNTIPLSFPRIGMIHSTIDSVLVDENELEWQFDLARTHENWKKLKKQDYKDFIVTQYGLLGWSGKSDYKGNIVAGSVKPQTKQTKLDADEYSQFDDGRMKLLEDLLAYIEKEKLNVLFVTTPFVLDDKWWGYENTLIKYFDEHYGDSDRIKYLNCNTIVDDIGIKFSTDFYDTKHVNINGAMKFTSFFGDYIIEKYGLKKSDVSKAYAAEWDAAQKLWWAEDAQRKIDKVKNKLEKLKEESQTE